MTDHVSTITCPKCGHREAETMPTDACQFFHEGRRLGRGNPAAL
jgi:hypothetical protein